MGLFARKPRDLEPAEATVLFAALTPKAARQTGKRNLEHEVKLSIERPDVGVREVTIETTVPWDRHLSQGDRVPVRISASDPEFVEIDFNGVKSVTEVGDAALRAAREGRAPTASELGFTSAETED